MKAKINANSYSSVKLTRDDIIFYYQHYKFPTDLITQEVSKIGDLVFSLESHEPDCFLQKTKKAIKLASCFIIEDELESKKGFKKGKINPHFKNKLENQTWRKAEPEDPGFFDDFRGKSDETKVFTFKRNLELVEKKELSISIEKTVLLDHLEMQDKEFFAMKKKEGNKEKNKSQIDKHNEIQENESNNNNNNSDNSVASNLQAKEITATADDLFSEQGIFSNIATEVIRNYLFLYRFIKFFI